MDMTTLKNIRKNYIPKKFYKPSNEIEISNFKLNNIVHISDLDILEKINSDSFSIHPVFPIIINEDGSEIYDIRDNFKLLIKNKSNKKKRNRCFIYGYGSKFVHRIVFESWNKILIKDDENIHHIDNNKENNYYKNLRALNKEAHDRIHNLK